MAYIVSQETGQQLYKIHTMTFFFSVFNKKHLLQITPIILYTFKPEPWCQTHFRAVATYCPADLISEKNNL